MRYVLLATAAAMMAVAASPTVPAHAQMDGNMKPKDPLELQYEAERRAQEDNEKAYNATMKRLKSQAPTTDSSDPWRNVRPAPGAKR